MHSYVHEFLKRILTNNRTRWWENLNSETNKNKGRCLQITIEQELSDFPRYRRDDRRLFFFSSQKSSSIDGRYKSLGVEEKFNPLDIEEHLIDGSIHRCVIWVLGNPHNLPLPIESLSLYVVQNNCAPIPSEIVDLYFSILHALFKLGIHIAFIDGKTGGFWRLDNIDSPKPLPGWLAKKESPIKWDRKIDLITPENQEALKILTNHEELQKRKITTKNLPGFGRKGEFLEVEINKSSKAAIIDYGNEWRLIELGLILRSLGYDAVKAIYNKEKHKNKKDQANDKVATGRGIEKRVFEEMHRHFSVLIDWSTKI